jgi:hypothetical protein
MDIAVNFFADAGDTAGQHEFGEYHKVLETLATIRYDPTNA